MYLWREHTEGCHLAYVLFITKILLLMINKGLLDGLTRHAYFGVSNTQKWIFFQEFSYFLGYCLLHFPLCFATS